MPERVAELKPATKTSLSFTGDDESMVDELI